MIKKITGGYCLFLFVLVDSRLQDCFAPRLWSSLKYNNKRVHVADGFTRNNCS